MNTEAHIRELIVRLARLESAAGWSGDLNPAQRDALNYLARANRFSRSPSHVADYLGTTRGTTSQSLKTLERKGYIVEERSEKDRRSISYSLTELGVEATSQSTFLDTSIKDLPQNESANLLGHLQNVLRNVVAQNGGRPFGMCKDCTYHRANKKGAFCTLLSLHLEQKESDQICNEQVPA